LLVWIGLVLLWRFQARAAPNRGRPGGDEPADAAEKRPPASRVKPRTTREKSAKQSPAPQPALDQVTLEQVYDDRGLAVTAAKMRNLEELYFKIPASPTRG